MSNRAKLSKALRRYFSKTLCTRLKKEALKYGADLEMEPIDILHQYHYWHGGEKVCIHYKGYRFSVCANGDIYAELYDRNGEYLTHVKDKNNSGGFYEEMADFISSDRRLHRLIKEERLLFGNNNWWECFLYLPDGYFVDMMWVLDAYSIKEAVLEVLENIDKIIAYYGGDYG